MVDYGQLTNMDTSNLTGAADGSGSLAGALSTNGHDIQAAAEIPTGMWKGNDSIAATDLMTPQSPKLFAASDAFKRSQAVLQDLVTDLESAQRRLQDARDLIAGTGITIGSDGTVTTPVVTDAAEADKNDRLAKQARGIIDEAVKSANDADDRAKGDISAAGLKADENAIPDEKGDSPKDVKKWWDSLSDAEKKAYIEQQPEKIGNLDGIPATARDEANRIALQDAIDAKNKEIADIKDDAGYGGPGSYSDQSDVKELQAELDGLENLQNVIDDPEHPDRLLLGLDPDGDGKAIVATSDPDKADNVLTHVPGMGSDLGSAGGELDRVDRMVSDASQLDPDKDTAGVMWLDYDAPDGITNAATSGYAEDGADDLANFQDGLRATHEGPASHNTVLGHSYGSTVTGHALRDHGMNADDVVFAGSPGVGVDHVSELGMNADDVHATRAENDIIGMSPEWRHGNNPAGSEFGAHSFESSPGDEGILGGRSTAAHSQYWDEGNPARDGIAKVVTDNSDDGD